MVQLICVLIAAEEVCLALLPAESPNTDIAVHWYLDQLRELRSPLHLGTARLCPHQGQHQEVRVKVRSVGSCSGENKTNKNTASGHGTTVLTSDWLGGDHQPAAATELRGRGQRMELQQAARAKLLRRDRAREAIFKGKSIEFLMTY